MDKILINPADIESCWEKPDACLVKTKTGKVWVCERSAIKMLVDLMENKTHEKLVVLPLKRGGVKHGK